ncbi:RE2 [Symbiodinium sp. CCMP2592]|nr:RE2 [Symbiodinium sp. CCMP2592]
MGDQSHGLRYFDGADSVDWREYRRWKLWCMNKFLVMDKLPKEARGSYVWTLLQGKALEMVEHLKESEYQKEGGEKVIFEILDKRWPERDRTDEMGENLTEVFTLRAREGELLRTWCARARECFDRCSRKTGVSFPEEAKGWIVLNHSGMNEAMRSCFPEYIVPRKRGVAAAHYVEAEDDSWWSGDYEDYVTNEVTTREGGEVPFYDVEMFLAEHGKKEDAPAETEVFPEAEVAEVLAATWKDRRQELNRLQRARKFPQANDLRRSFRVEIEELKRRTQCRKCGRTGHWARECPMKSSAAGASGSGSTSAAGMVQHVEFVCHAVQIPQSMVEQLRSRRDQGPEQELLLVSSPGFAVLDSGCGKSVIGEITLQAFRKLWSSAGIEQPAETPELNTFRFGNGAQQVSNRIVTMPVCLGGRRGVVRAAVIGGQAPLLLSRPALKTLAARMDFGRDELVLFEGHQAIPMSTNEAGQYIIPVANFESQASPGHQGTPAEPEDCWELASDGLSVSRIHHKPRTDAFTPCSEGCPVEIDRLLGTRRTFVNPPNGVDPREVVDDWRVPENAHRSLQERPWTGRTVFQVEPISPTMPSSEPPEPEDGAAEQWSPHQWRQLTGASGSTAKVQPDKVHILEVFGAPRYALEAVTKGLNGASADRITGWDFRRAADRDLILQTVTEQRPELLVLGSPCTWQAGWYDIDPVHSDESTRREKAVLSKLLLNFAADVASRQLEHGGRFVKSVLRTVRELPRFGACVIQVGSDHECFVAGRVAELNEQRREQMLASLRKLHANLGHPPNPVLVRVLKHGGASQVALDLARELSCDLCAAQKQPTPAPLAQTHRVTEFNRRVGLDVKYLPGWLPNQKIPALNIVDYASSFQIMVPLPGRETGETLRQAFQERWVSWAGVPHEIVVDPAQTNLSEALTVPQELAGSVVAATAAEAHWQLGKVEVHGGWFGRVLQKVIAECAAHDRPTWVECVVGAHCKNELIQVYGMTPSQFVFGRNPRVPSNLLDEPLDVIPATASLHEDAVARSVAIRQAARQAALRLSLAARPRVLEQHAPGSLVAYWRTQKSHEGTIERGGRWYGPAVVLGQVGKNLVVVHKRQVFRCAPEQVRKATSEEQALVSTPNAELLGFKHLIDTNALSSRQYMDLVPLDRPPLAEQEQPASMQASAMPQAPALSAGAPSAGSAAPGSAQGPLSVPSAPVVPGSGVEVDRGQGSSRDHLNVGRGSQPFKPKDPPETPSPNAYGPVRRVTRKTSPEQLHRPSAMLQDDFSELMQEVIPELVSQTMQATMPDSQVLPNVPEAPSARGVKREASAEPAVRESSRRATENAPEGQPGDDENLAVEALLVQVADPSQSIETLMAQALNKRQSKEVPATGNPLELQTQVDEAKTVEWNTILSRNATRLVLGREAEKVRRKFSDRIMDPDLAKKAVAGDLQSPTLSQVGRSVLFQLISSHKWLLRLGDIKGAFLSSGELPASYRPLYARLPPGGIPGVPSDALIEVLGHVYGLNDAPSAWQKTLNKALLEVGFERSRFDPCVYYMRDQGRLVGVYGVHVDDSATGGEGDKYNQAIEALRKKFEFRKWRIGDGDFCGARYRQDPVSFDITMSQESFVDKLRPLRLSRSRLLQKDAPLTTDEIRCLRAINGGLNWLATQSRPDLSTQVSFSQQSFPEPLVSDAVAANNAVRRARQNAQLPIVFRAVPPEQLAVMCHSDAAYANGRDGATQAGFVVSFTHKDMNDGVVQQWTPANWRSYRLPRVVNSTLSAEAQAMSTATGMLEWILLLLSEALDGPCNLRNCWQYASRRCSMALTDCKSLYDHLVSKSSPTLDDKRTALDVVIVRESLGRVDANLRWIPTNRMIADGLTKETIEAIDLLRACLRTGQYQISDEQHVLDWRADEKQRRKDRAAL